MEKLEVHISQLVRGSYKSFTVIYEHFAPQLYSFVFNLTHSKSRSKDIVQETFLKIWEKRDEINETLSFRSYLFTIAKNRLLNEIRDQVRNPLFTDYIEVALYDEEVDSGVESKIDFDNFNKHVQETKQKLTLRQRQIFELNKEGGIPIKEIAEELSISEQVVRNHLSAALRILRAEMKKYFILFVLFFS